MKRFLLPLSLLAGIIAAVPVTAQEDQVFGKNGAPTRGTISAINPQAIEMVVTGGRRNFSVRDILKVTFGEEPEELATARDRALAGQYADAIEELKNVNMAEISTKAIRQEAGYYAAYCVARQALTEGGDKQAASEMLFRFLRENQDTYHFFEGAELLGDLYFANGEYSKAATFYGALAGASWPDYKMRAAVLEGRALVAAENFPAAQAKFDQVLAAGTSTPEAVEQRLQATVGKAVCLAATGQAESGIEMIEDLIAKNDPRDAALFGRAYNALGACYEKVGKTQDALLAYLHTDVLFFADPQVHAEALYHLAQLWDSVNQADRAVQARSLLQTRYAGTRWARMP